MNLPHQFPSLVGQQTNTKPVLLIGAGMSSGIAPRPDEFVKELDQSKLETRLGCSAKNIKIDSGDSNTLYQWAEEIIEGLLEQGKPEEQAKKELADALEITTDLRWRGLTKIPLRGNTPRHRVVARLAREGRLHALWSLNWDCVLETALESVGLPLRTGNTPPKKQPWPEWHITWTQPEDLPPPNDINTVLVIKPHGCAKKLIFGEYRTFKITARELADVRMNEEAHKVMVDSHFINHPLLACGWGAKEQYLQSWFSDLGQRGAIPPNVSDPFSIIDIKPSPDHLSIANTYGITESAQFQFVVDTNQITSDVLFLWIQTCFGLNQLKKLPNSPDVLDELLSEMQSLECNHWLYGWFDNFLPIWVRFCFNSGLTSFCCNAAKLNINVVPTDRRDEHIPWSDHNALRPDLHMATQLLTALAESGVGKSWDTGRFPGGFWDNGSRRLVLPLPCLAQNQVPSLLSLRAMADSHHWERKGDIAQLDILPINENGTVVPSVQQSEGLRQSVSNMMKHSHLANSSNIRIVDFSTLTEVMV